MNNLIEKMLRMLAKELDISEEKYDKAVISYEAVGNYLNNNIEDSDIRIFSQGSFKLGTVIKPLNDEDDYDIDLVCLVGKNYNNPKDLKNEIGNVLKNSDRYCVMLEKNEDGSYKEGKRCWTINYSDDAQYHMDILPAIASSRYNTNKKLLITNKDEVTGNYEFTSTNPEEYYSWFKGRMQEEQRKLLLEYAQAKKLDIETVPEYKVKTTLQVAIQILKRYRDIMFQETPDDKPISIILTTILASMYNGEGSVYELIKRFTEEFHLYIQKDKEGHFIIKNPVNPEENFADKWIIYPEREKAFFSFMQKLKQDIIDNKLLITGQLFEQAKTYKSLFGEKVVERAYSSIGDETRILRESGELYVNSNGKLNSQKDGNQVKGHNFHGN